MKKVQRIYLNARIALVHWQLRDLERHRRRTVAEFMLAVDESRREAQELLFQRGQYIAHHKAGLEQKLRHLKQKSKEVS